MNNNTNGTERLYDANGNDSVITESVNAKLKKAKEYSSIDITIHSDNSKEVECFLKEFTGTTVNVYYGRTVCCPEDTFNLNIGINIATERALDKFLKTKKEETKEETKENINKTTDTTKDFIIQIDGVLSTIKLFGMKIGEILIFKNGVATYPNGNKSLYYKNFNRFCRSNPCISKHIHEVKFEKRQAKVGEYILITNSDNSPSNKYENGDVLQCKKTTGINYVIYNERTSSIIFDHEYVVLSNYRTDYDNVEVENKGYNGKVICTKDRIAFDRIAFTKGKIYTITNGQLKTDNRNNFFAFSLPETFAEVNRRADNIFLEVVE